MFPPNKGEGNALGDILSEIEFCGVRVCVKSREGLGMRPLKIWGKGIGLIVESHVGGVEINFDTKKQNWGSSLLVEKGGSKRGRVGGGETAEKKAV